METRNSFLLVSPTRQAGCFKELQCEKITHNSRYVAIKLFQYLDIISMTLLSPPLICLHLYKKYLYNHVKQLVQRLVDEGFNERRFF